MFESVIQQLIFLYINWKKSEYSNSSTAIPGVFVVVDVVVVVVVVVGVVVVVAVVVGVVVVVVGVVVVVVDVVEALVVIWAEKIIKLIFVGTSKIIYK